jgi:hypothetical protein
MNTMQSADTVLQGVDADVLKYLTPHIKEIQWFADDVCPVRDAQLSNLQVSY